MSNATMPESGTMGDGKTVAEFILIPLTKGQFAKVDADDHASLSVYKWSALWTKNTNSFRAVRVIRVGKIKRTVYMHREVMGAKMGDQPVDHENHDTLDNRKQNLRNAGDGKNQFNTRRRSDNTSGAKGVFRRRETGRWRYMVRAGKQLRSGRYDSLEQCIAARNAAALELHGEFAHA